jgi:diguanylate cyclase (GGDEF)-like protein/PAS domain S-box-containing protein
MARVSATIARGVVNGRAAPIRNEALFRELATNIPIAIWVRDIERQTVEYVNDAWRALTGLDVRRGDPVEAAYGAIHPEDLQWVMHERRKSGGAQDGADYRLIGADGAIRWVHGRTFPLSNAFSGPISDLGAGAPVPFLVEIMEDVTERREAQRQLLHLAWHDALTNLPNRTKLYEALADAMARADRDGHGVALLLLDVDAFKTVNDTLGHAIGDDVLREFAARLAAWVRPGDTVGRLGGDEFAVVVPAPAGIEAGIEVANRIRDALRQPFVVENRAIPMTASIGIARYPEDTTDMESLIRHADAAMYEAKAQGRNRLSCHAAGAGTRGGRREALLQPAISLEGALPCPT